ncbi:hypothetical protein M011DRAFT_511760 [Sporormia fimetaria CBS 119925]|uniref:Uncharacterized protein n=1 Tax=Sporormia fimetaria CBS 119925 TaxID=1340428 RepID=A0A6A6VIV1_9PLEO|nr:hypothetical protein M011DRAFT_511760 [Sporormia fimetaria CBS 119925]
MAGPSTHPSGLTELAMHHIIILPWLDLIFRYITIFMDSSIYGHLLIALILVGVAAWSHHQNRVSMVKVEARPPKHFKLRCVNCGRMTRYRFTRRSRSSSLPTIAQRYITLEAVCGPLSKHFVLPTIQWGYITRKDIQELFLDLCTGLGHKTAVQSAIQHHSRRHPEQLLLTWRPQLLLTWRPRLLLTWRPQLLLTWPEPETLLSNNCHQHHPRPKQLLLTWSPRLLLTWRARLLLTWPEWTVGTPTSHTPYDHGRRPEQLRSTWRPPLLLVWHQHGFRRHPKPLQLTWQPRSLLTWPKQKLLESLPSCTIVPTTSKPELNLAPLFLCRNITEWPVFEGGVSPHLAVNLDDFLVDLPGISNEFNYYHLSITHVEPVWPHQEEEYDNYKPPSRLLASRGIKLWPLRVPPKARHTLAGFKRVPDRLFWETTWCEVEGAPLLNNNTYRKFVTGLLPRHGSSSDHVQPRGHLTPDSTSRFDGAPNKLGDYPSPMFAESLLRVLEMYWMENNCLPNPSLDPDFQQVIIQTEVLTEHYCKKCVTTGDDAKDDIRLWLFKKDNFMADYQYFEADEDCVDPDAKSVEEEEDDEDDFREPTAISRQMDLLPEPSREEITISKYHDGMTQRKVNSIFAWINYIAVEEGATITGCHQSYVSTTGEEVTLDIVECFQQLVAYRCRHETTAPTALGQYLPVTKEQDPKLARLLKSPMFWKKVMKLQPELPEVIAFGDERFEGLTLWAQASVKASAIFSNTEVLISEGSQYVWNEDEITLCVYKGLGKDMVQGVVMGDIYEEDTDDETNPPSRHDSAHSQASL